MIKIFLLIFLSYNAYALEFMVVGPCDDRPLFSKTIKLDSTTQNLGQLTKQTLVENNIIHEGTDKKISTIYNIPQEDQKIEIISDQQMYAYGWCFSVNGKVPDSYGDKIEVTDNDVIIWYLAGSHYNRGEWLSMCEYANLRKPDLFCKK
jgi:hypothetical protein